MTMTPSIVIPPGGRPRVALCVDLDVGMGFEEQGTSIGIIRIFCSGRI